MKNNVEQEEPVEAMESKEEVEQPKVKKEIKINVRTVRMIAVIVVVLLSAYFLKSCFIAATVNGTPISRISVIHQLEKASGKSVLEGIITQKLITDAAKKQGITVSADEIAVEMKKIDDQLVASGQGITLDALLTQRGMTRDDLTKQIVIQKDVEKLLGDKVAVTDAEVEKYITDNKITIPKGEEAKTAGQIKEALMQQKVSQQGQALVDSLRTAAKINYFVQY